MKLSNLLQSVTKNTASIDGVWWYPVRPMTAGKTFILQRVKAEREELGAAARANGVGRMKTHNAKVSGRAA